MKTKYRSIIYQNDQKNKPNLMGYFSGANKILFEKSFFLNSNKNQNDFQNTMENLFQHFWGVVLLPLNTFVQVFFVRKVFE